MEYSRAGSIRLGLLNNAAEDTFLWHLPSADFAPVQGEVIQIEPALPVPAVSAVLEGLLRDGLVELYEHSYRSPLPLEDALAAIADDANWHPGGTPLSLSITDRGVEEYARDYPPSADPDSY